MNEALLDGSLEFKFHKRNFKLSIKQVKDEEKGETATIFDISTKRTNLTVFGNITHIIKNEECVTVITKSDTVEHKCYGGIGEGKILIDRVF